MLVLNVSSVAVLWFGGLRVDAGQMQVGALTAFLAYLLQILMAVMMATFMAMMIPRAAVCAERIGEVLDTRPSVVPPGGARDRAPRRDGLLVFDRVGFRYPGADAPVLHEISFAARPGTTTAVVGSTGSGKTTLLSLVPRLFDVTAGAVLGRRGRRARARPAGAGRAHRLRAAAALPVLRHRRVEPAPRPAGRHRRRAVGGAGGRPGAPTSCARCPAGSTRRSRRAARTSPAASASGWRSPGRWSAGPRSTCSTTRSPRWTSPPTRGCGRRSARSRRTPPW